MDIIVFGTGKYYEVKKDSIKKIYNIVGFFDNKVEYGDTKLFDNENRVINPIQWRDMPEVPIFLMSVKFVEMYEQLVLLGVDNKRIHFGTEFAPVYDPFEELLDECHGKLMVKGKYISLEVDGKEYMFNSTSELERIVREIYREKKPEIDLLRSLPIYPVSRRYGREHGTPIDRYYIEQFLEENKDRIRGDIAEFAEDTYTKRYGKDLKNSYIYHVYGWGENVKKINLVTGDGVEEEVLDCLICTQTIQFIYELDKAINNIVRLLKIAGCALITVHGIAQISLYDYRNWGEYWRFTKKTLENMMASYCNIEYEIHSYGNVKIAAAMLYGLAVEDLDKKDFGYDDEQYPVILTLMVTKKYSHCEIEYGDEI